MHQTIKGNAYEEELWSEELDSFPVLMIGTSSEDGKPKMMNGAASKLVVR